MNRLLKISTSFFFIFICSTLFGQMNEYNYKRELTGISEDWHRIELSNDILSKTSQNLSDIRIYGITPSKDTIESPYLLKNSKDKFKNKNVEFKMLNVSHNENGYFFTFEIPTQESFNEIKLEFKQKNFDWNVKLEGSNSQNEWFTITEKYRILSIKNELTDFQFTNLTFPDSKYRYVRLFIDSKIKPELLSSSISQNQKTDGIFEKYEIKNIQHKELKKEKITQIELELFGENGISKIKFNVSNRFDYYRPLRIEYLSDSIQTEKGLKYVYKSLTAETLNSLDKNEFSFQSITTKRVRIFIENQNNQPLNIDSFEVSGYTYELVTRFTEKADYFLVYGNKKAFSPTYDIDRFVDKIPKELKTLTMGQEISIEGNSNKIKDPLFQNKAWLWAIIAVIILVLGGFTLKMMRNE